MTCEKFNFSRPSLMSDPTTKQKIVHASIKLFNENGVANVRLQQIADEIGISVGNLAYHFNLEIFYYRIDHGISRG